MTFQKDIDAALDATPSNLILLLTLEEVNAGSVSESLRKTIEQSIWKNALPEVRRIERHIVKHLSGVIGLTTLLTKSNWLQRAKTTTRNIKKRFENGMTPG